MTEFCVQTSHLSKVFGNKTAVNDLNLEIKSGGIHAIVGSNGAGKSTLFRILLGVETPSSGQALILGQNAQSLSSEIRGRIGYVNEEHTLPAWMRVSELLAMQKKLYTNWNSSVYANVIGYFDVQENQKVAQLSRGERAGFNLAMALAQSPEILILDEPTLGLDVVAKQSFLEALMFSESEHKCTIIYCSHQMEESERVADQLIILEKGVVTNNSSPDAFVERVMGVIADFGTAEVEPQDIDGLLSCKKIDEHHQLILIDQNSNALQEQLQEKGVTDIVPINVSLQQAVNAFLTKHHHAPASTVA